MSRLMLFPSAVKRDPVIEDWMHRRSGALGEIAQHWFEVMRTCGDDVRELLHDGHPTACVEDAAFGYVNAFTAHVNVGFFLGAELSDPSKLLEGTGKFMRHVKLRPGRAVDALALRKLIEAAYVDMKGRLRKPPPPRRSAQSSSMSDVAPFYDGLAPYYHLLYGDWEASVAKQGAALARLLEIHGVRRGEAILDAACGIGTQTIGLLMNGYSVTASDCSPGAVDRLRSELLKRGLSSQAYVDDLRSLRHSASASFSAVVACDNSIPHLLTDAELLECFRSCLRCLRPGGVGVFSVRDYAAIPRVSPDVHPYGVRNFDDGRFLAVQVWDWDGDHYDLRIYLTFEQRDGRCTTEVLRSRYYAVTIDRLLTLMQTAGFVATERMDGVLFQPVLVGRRSNAE